MIKIKKSLHKRAQEEIVGFSMIIVIVAVILIIFLSISLNSNKKNTVESYEVESFLQSVTQKTSDCRSMDNLRYYSIKELVFKCYSGASSGIAEMCFDTRNTCDVLLNDIGILSNKSWNPGAGEDFPVKGYLLNITADGVSFETLGYGNQTKSSKGSFQELRREGKLFRLEFYAYY